MGVVGRTSMGAALKLPDRWYPLRFHPVQNRLWHSPLRFMTSPAGRRSGKTERMKRKLIRRALGKQHHREPWYVFACPVQHQAKKIYWLHLKQFTKPWWRKKPSETELTVYLANGADISVVGMDKPERVEGRSLTGIVLDEFGNMKKEAWKEHVRPALSDHKGFAWFIGVPEGRNHYFDLVERAKDPANKRWGNFHWLSADILDAEEMADALEDMDLRTFRQEYEGSFLDYSGRVYSEFDRDVHAREELFYNETLPLIITLDFNIAPGTACILQEQKYTGLNNQIADQITACLGEVWIPTGSNTTIVCRKIMQDWRHHKGDVYIYGDASGGAGHSSQTKGSDWDIVRETLKPLFGPKMVFRYHKKNPAVRSRVNSFNSRLRTADGFFFFFNTPTGTHVRLSAFKFFCITQ